MELSNEKCRTHGQRYCSESGCCISLVAAAPGTPVSTPNDFEDSLVGRPQVAKPAISPQPVSASTLAPVQSVRSQPVDQPQKVEPDSHPLVTASLEYAKASEVYRKATEFVRDCEKRLEFAKGEVLEASEAKSQAFERVKALIGE